MPRWYDSDNPTTVARGATWRAMVWTLAVLAFVSACVGAAWGIRVATSDIKGRGDSQVQVNDGRNRLAQQAYFEQTYADIRAVDRTLDALAADKAAKVDGADVRYTGAIAYCQRLTGDYNAAARKEIAAKFRDAGLPAQIDPLDATTDCKETPK